MFYFAEGKKKSDLPLTPFKFIKSERTEMVRAFFFFFPLHVTIAQRKCVGQ